MQNGAVATIPDKSKPVDGDRAPRVEQDFSLDPLPVPHAVESNSDTAWSLWEYTLRKYEEEAQDETERLEDLGHTDFADTMPFDPSEPQI